MFHTTFAALCLFAVADAQQSPDALELLTRSREAAAAVQSLAYESTLMGDGALAKAFSILDGRVQFKPGPTDTAHKLFIDGTRTVPNSAISNSFRYVCDGALARQLDDRARTFTEGPAADGQTSERDGLFPRGYFTASAYAEELRAARVSLAGTAKIADIECDVVEVHYDPQARKRARLFIARTDRLLRRIERPMMLAVKGTLDAPNATVIFTINRLAVNPAIPDEAFKLSAPDGYARQDFKRLGETPAGPATVAGAPPAAPGAAGPARLPRVFGLLQRGTEAPDWTLKSAEGKDVTLNGLRGKVVVLDFWASWCGPCRMAMPGVEKIHDDFKDKPVAVFGVNCSERSPTFDAAAFVRQKGVSYGQLVKGDAVASGYGVRGLPSFFVIGKDGKVLYSGGGFNGGAVRAAVEEGLK